MTRGARWFAVGLVAAVVATGCTSAGPEVDQVPVEQPSDTSDGGATGTGAPSPTPRSTAPAPGSSTPADGATAGGGGQDGGGSSAPPQGDQLTPVNDDGGVGANGRAMLRADRASLVLEIDVQSGMAVDDDAVAHLVDVLGSVTAAPQGVRLAGGNTFDSDRTSWTTADLRQAARANRSTASTDQQVSVHVMYVRGAHAEDGQQTQAIGLSYSASTVALFPDRWSGLGSLLGSDTAIERAVLVHELGHLFGLVNLTYTSATDHEDPEHPGHSDNRDSVMFHAIETTAIGQAFSGPPPDTFDDADRADLEGLRTGRY